MTKAQSSSTREALCGVLVLLLQGTCRELFGCPGHSTAHSSTVRMRRTLTSSTRRTSILVFLHAACAAASPLAASRWLGGCGWTAIPLPVPVCMVTAPTLVANSRLMVLCTRNAP